MDVLDPVSRRALQVASYQRDELFHRNPNIIPPSLKMLVDPRPSERTMALLNSINDEPFAVPASRQPIRRQASEGVGGETTVVKAMTELTLIAERVSSLRDKYINEPRSRAPGLMGGGTEKELESLDAAINDCGIDARRLQRVRKYYDDLLQHTAAVANPQTKLVCHYDSGKDKELSTDQVSRESELETALRRVIWYQTDLQGTSLAPK